MNRQDAKTYEVADRARRPIRYEDRLSADGDQIECRWTISVNWFGRFVMVRSRPKSAQAEMKRRVAEPVD